jgi:hypothetical protein
MIKMTYSPICVPSAFFCLIALLLSSVIWYAARSVQTMSTISILYSVGIQEIFRWCYFLLIQRAEAGLNLVAKYPSSPYNKIEFGFGNRSNDLLAVDSLRFVLALRFSGGVWVCLDNVFSELYLGVGGIHWSWCLDVPFLSSSQCVSNFW